MFRKLLAATTLILLSGIAQSATLAVFPDINMIASDSMTNTGNQAVFNGLLGADNAVRVWAPNGSTYHNDLAAYYSNSGAAVSVTNTSSGAIPGATPGSTGLLVLSFNYASSFYFSGSQTQYLIDHMDAGGNLAIILEVSSNSSSHNQMNVLLANLGSSIRYASNDRVGPGYQNTNDVSGDLMNGATSFRFAYANPLTGGTSNVRVGGTAIVASEVLGGDPVPVPAAVWLFGSALAGLGWMRRRA